MNLGRQKYIEHAKPLMNLLNLFTPVSFMSTHFVQLSPDEFLKEAVGIVEKAQSRGLCLRILGALATYIRSVNNCSTQMFMSLERFGKGMPLFTDLDLAAYGKQRGDIDKLFREMLFQPDEPINSMFGHKRLIYYHPRNSYHVDVFLNRLEFSHDVEFGEKPGEGRLELDFPTISPTDIVLEKLQIHQINRKDLIDLISLFIVHKVEDQSNTNVIDGAYIAKILSDDWGFWYDATTNVGEVKSLLAEVTEQGKLTITQGQTAIQRMDKLLNIITNCPKTRKWEKRAKAGTKKPWYRDVEDVVL